MQKTIWAASLILASSLLAQTPPSHEKLRFVVIMSRHGVRSFLSSNETLNQYSAEPWPTWDVPIGYLTKRGRTLMEFMGDYYREYLTKQAILPASGCSAVDQFYFWSDTDQRDVETGHAIADRMFRNCPVVIHTVPAGKSDALFSPVRAGIVTIANSQPSLAALSQRIGGPPETLIPLHRERLLALQKVLLGCEPGKTCSPDRIAGRKILMDLPSSVRQPVALAELNSPIRAASEIVDNFLLEYTEGLPLQQVGWGRVNKSNLRDLLFLQKAYIDLVLRTPYLARAGGSNLMSHILRSLQQAAEGKTVAGALGKASDKGLIFLGHDSNESNLGGLLDISWNVADYPPDSRPPGSALVFELWKNSASGKYAVRTWFTTQTLDQMRNATPLSLKHPPVRTAVQLPGCGSSCEWEKFRSIVEADIDPAFVSNQSPE